VGRAEFAQEGSVSQPLTGCPPNPANVTSYTLTVLSGVSTGSKRASRSCSRVSWRVLAQKVSKSSGSADALRYARSSSRGRSNWAMKDHLLTSRVRMITPYV
jgi:hypothetical protein